MTKEELEACIDLHGDDIYSFCSYLTGKYVCDGRKGDSSRITPHRNSIFVTGCRLDFDRTQKLFNRINPGGIIYLKRILELSYSIWLLRN